MAVIAYPQQRSCLGGRSWFLFHMYIVEEMLMSGNY